MDTYTCDICEQPVSKRPKEKGSAATLAFVKSQEDLKKTVAKARARNAYRRPEDIEAAIDQALDEVRAERFGSARPKSPRR